MTNDKKLVEVVIQSLKDEGLSEAEIKLAEVDSILLAIAFHNIPFLSDKKRIPIILRTIANMIDILQLEEKK
jgi:hypothetical protein